MAKSYRAQVTPLTAAAVPTPPRAAFIPPDADEVVDFEKIRADLEASVRKAYDTVIYEVGTEFHAQGINFDIRTSLAEETRHLIGEKAAFAADKALRDSYREVIEEALQEGWSVPTTANAIVGRIDAHAGARATTLARTDLVGASNSSSYISALREFEGKEGVRKQWLATSDERTRDTHRLAHGQTRPLREPFRVGFSAMRYPGDPWGPPEEVFNCRCTIIYTTVDPSPLAEVRPSETLLADAQKRWSDEAIQAINYDDLVELNPDFVVVDPSDQTSVVNESQRQTTIAAWKEKMEQKMRFTMGKNDVRAAVRADSYAAEKIIAQGRFKSQFEAETSRGMYDPRIRASAELDMFHYPKDLAKADRPIYGYVSGITDEHGAVTGYGEVKFLLKPEVKARTTFTSTDSLNSGLVPAPLLNPRLTAVYPTRMGMINQGVRLGSPMDEWDIVYWEAQIHGGVDMSDVEKITVYYERYGYEQVGDPGLIGRKARAEEIAERIRARLRQDASGHPGGYDIPVEVLPDRAPGTGPLSPEELILATSAKTKVEKGIPREALIPSEARALKRYEQRERVTVKKLPLLTPLEKRELKTILDKFYEGEVLSDYEKGILRDAEEIADARGEDVSALVEGEPEVPFEVLSAGEKRDLGDLLARQEDEPGLPLLPSEKRLLEKAERIAVREGVDVTDLEGVEVKALGDALSVGEKRVLRSALKKMEAGEKLDYTEERIFKKASEIAADRGVEPSALVADAAGSSGFAKDRVRVDSPRDRPPVPTAQDRLHGQLGGEELTLAAEDPTDGVRVALLASDEDQIRVRAAASNGNSLHLAQSSPMAGVTSSTMTTTPDDLTAAVVVTITDDEAPSEAERVPWQGILAIAGKPTSDRRYLIPGEIGERELPLPLAPSHEAQHESDTVGRIESIQHIPASEFEQEGWDLPEDLPPQAVVIWGEGSFDGSANAQDALRALENGVGVSLDLPMERQALIDATTYEEIDPSTLDGEDVLGMMFGQIPEGYLHGIAGKIGGLSLASIAAFEETTIRILDDHALVASGFELERVPDPFLARLTEEMLKPIVASAAPLEPPREWFFMEEPDEPTPLTIKPDGRVFGHLALWNTCHAGRANGAFDSCMLAPHSPSGYSQYHLGSIMCEDGSEVPIGRMTIGTGHAPLHLNAAAARKHYDNTGTCVAYVRAKDGIFGIWLSGVIRSDATDEAVRDLRACPPSGDWRSHDGRLELQAALAVNSPGYPVPRSQLALAASSDPLDPEVTTLILGAPDRNDFEEALRVEYGAAVEENISMLLDLGEPTAF